MMIGTVVMIVEKGFPRPLAHRLERHLGV